MEYRRGDYGLSLFYEHAGLFTFWAPRITVHLLPSRAFWIWGYDVLHWQLGIAGYGLGPLALVFWEA